jgi:hypothetical protein
MSSFATTVACGGLPIIRYENALFHYHEMRWSMLCQCHINLSDAISHGISVCPPPHLILNIQNLAKWDKGISHSVI